MYETEMDLLGNSNEEEEEDEEDAEEKCDAPHDIIQERVDSLEERVEELSEEAKQLDREREPFKFQVFRDSEGNVIQWVLMQDADVGGEPSQIPVAFGMGEDIDTPASMWIEYTNRIPGEAEGTVFEFSQREEITPSNTFYKWVAETVEAIAEYNNQIKELDNPDAFNYLSPNLPPLYDELAVYEKAALRFFGDIIVEHNDYTEEQTEVIHEALRRYDMDHTTIIDFMGKVDESTTDEKDHKQAEPKARDE